ncbi:Myrosinase 1 [Eumeta japonica]|uniref:Myrosinase 1 n=1 Tax=Eumeta variegata TaxID=151549 RepID=A0A4C1WWD0_EUMVA|nr:Myrosinase 1 [Eumeta japonica]
MPSFMPVEPTETSQFQTNATDPGQQLAIPARRQELIFFCPLNEVADLFSILAGWLSGLHGNSTGRPLLEFPPEFMFGVSTAAYQIEGGWKADDKSPSIWDVSVHKDPCWIANCSSGDVAADSYHLYERDAAMLAELGVDFYRFSISWPRVLPEGPGRGGARSAAGFAYYRRLIAQLKQRGIQPFVTLYHWDLPQYLQDLGGWTNPLIVDWFTDYARVVFEELGDDIKYWTTINEPFTFCWFGYGLKTFAPRVNLPELGVYLCAKHVVLAHAKVYRIYRDEFKMRQNGKLGISNCLHWYEPVTKSLEDIKAVNDILEFQGGLFTSPVYSKAGDFPGIVKEIVANKSAEQGYSGSRLSLLTAQEVEYVRGTYDFLGVNHYSTYVVYRNATAANRTSNAVYGLAAAPSYLDDIGVGLTVDPKWLKSPVSSTSAYFPSGFYKLLTYLRKKYDNPPLIITEHGWPTAAGLKDDDRIKYMRGYLGALQQAVQDGSDVRGYAVRSLMDGFEWTSGYVRRFGLYEVDFESARRVREPRKSAYVYQEIIRSRVVDPRYVPSNYTTIKRLQL